MKKLLTWVWKLFGGDVKRRLKELDENWFVLERSGYSKEGLAYATLLEEKKALGVALSAVDEQRIAAAAKARKDAASLPTIKGAGSL